MTESDLKQVRFYVAVAAILAFAAAYLLATAASVGNIDDQRVRCESGNQDRYSRLIHLDHLVLINVNRTGVAGAAGDWATAGANALATKLYGEDRQALVASQAGAAVEPGDVRIDCVAAYPKPFPFNLLEGDST